MSPDDILFSPIIPAETARRLRDLVKRIMATQPNDKLATVVANEIVDLFRQNGIYEENEIVDAVHRIIKEVQGNLYTNTAMVFAVTHELTQVAVKRQIDAMVDAVFTETATLQSAQSA